MELSRLLCLLALLLNVYSVVCLQGPYSVFINEIHYDNVNTDTGEGIEVLGPSTASMDNLKLYLYNGGAVAPTSSVYGIYSVGAGNFPNQGSTGWGAVNIATPNIQNGPTDGVALVLDCTSTGGGLITLQFLCYEGTFTPVDGPAAGTTCTDIGVAETTSTPTNQSLQLSGTGSISSSFNWNYPTTATPGAINASQTLLTTNLNIPTCPSPCATTGNNIIKISDVQGSGAASSLVNQTVSVVGVVVADFQGGSGSIGGFYLQDKDGGDGNSATSDSIFVKDGCSTGTCLNIAVGDVVKVTGVVAETNSLTQIQSTEVLSCTKATGGYKSTGITPSVLTLPAVGDAAARNAYFEAFEGMLVTINDLTVADVSNLGTRGEVVLSQGGRPFSGTNVAAPGAAALAVEANWKIIILDDDASFTSMNRDPIVYPAPSGLTYNNTLRAGQVVTSLTAVLTYACRGGDCDWRLVPISPSDVVFDISSNSRPTSGPYVGLGNVKVGSMNLYNFFNGDGNQGGFPTVRGADTYDEYNNRQLPKLVSAINGIGADVLALMEVENDGYDALSAIQQLVNALNTATSPGTWAFVYPGQERVGTDFIAVKIIYKPAVVSKLGSAAILNSTVDSTFDSSRNRPVLAQTFVHLATGRKFTLAAVHLRSKLPDCNAVNDPNMNDGQGDCNKVRTNAAKATVNWLKTDPTKSGTATRFLVVGDMNANRMEDPCQAFKTGGLVDLVETYQTADQGYSYIYNVASGELDHVYATAELAADAVGAAVWHINADEPEKLDYNVEYKTTNQLTSLYGDTMYRASDHDPLLVGFNFKQLSPPPPPSPPPSPPPKPPPPSPPPPRPPPPSPPSPPPPRPSPPPPRPPPPKPPSPRPPPSPPPPRPPPSPPSPNPPPPRPPPPRPPPPRPRPPPKQAG